MVLISLKWQICIKFKTISDNRKSMCDSASECDKSNMQCARRKNFAQATFSKIVEVLQRVMALFCVSGLFIHDPEKVKADKNRKFRSSQRNVLRISRRIFFFQSEPQFLRYYISSLGCTKKACEFTTQTLSLFWSSKSSDCFFLCYWKI